MIGYQTTAAVLADANLLDSVRVLSRWQDPCELSEENGLLMMAGATRYPIACTNAAVCLDPQLPPGRVLQRARDFFLERRRGFTFMIRAAVDGSLERLLAAQGLIFDMDAPCMMIASPVPEPTIKNVRVELLSELRHVADIVSINSEAYQSNGLPVEQARALFTRPQAVLSDAVAGVIAYQGEQPVATALTVMSKQSAGLYWVGTVPSARGLGLAKLCASMATNLGFQRGAKVVTLQASRFGESIYKALGYREYDRLRSYRHASPPRLGVSAVKD